jgi:tetratricopeptide (TPR) repeat protein
MRKSLLSIVLFLILAGLNVSAQDNKTKTDKKNKDAYWPKTSSGLALFCYSFIEDQNWQSAEYYITEAIARDSTVGFYYDLRGGVRVNAKNFNGALADYNKALKFDSFDYDAYGGRAQVYYALEDYDKALADLNSAISLDSEKGANYELRAKIELRQGKCSAAQSDMKKAEVLTK